MISTKCKKCRRAGQKLFLKGERCYSQKCAMIKRPYPPGIHGKRRSSLSEYGRQLLEKQKIRNIYGIAEKQFKKYIDEAMQKTGDKREIFLKKLEKRLDNVIFRLGIAPSRFQARQIVSHGHILINGRKMDIPSYEVRVGDIIGIKKKSLKTPLFQNLQEVLKKKEIPNWLKLDVAKIETRVIRDVAIEDVKEIQDLGMIIEFYSR